MKSYRVGKKVKQKLIANIGRLDELLENGDIETLITNLSRILEEEKGKQYVDTKMDSYVRMYLNTACHTSFLHSGTEQV